MVKLPYRNRMELLQGTLDLMVLQTLQWGLQHGYGISLAIRNRSGEILQVDTGSLYPRPAPSRETEVGGLGMESFREQTARQILPADLCLAASWRRNGRAGGSLPALSPACSATAEAGASHEIRMVQP